MGRRQLRIGGLALAAVAALVAGARAEVVQRGDLRVYIQGGITPKTLPRLGRAPVAVSVAGHVVSTSGSVPPQLTSVAVALNRNGRLDFRGLPVCPRRRIEAVSSRQALALCGRALVGTGTFHARVVLPDQSPFPSDGRVLAFNGRQHGQHVVFAHIYGPRPLPQSRVLTFHLRQQGGGYRTLLSARLPEVTTDWGYVSRLSLTLGRRYRYRGRSRSFIAAGCPAPSGFSAATFPAAKASFGFADGRTLTSTLIRSCRVRGS
ncbi:MAG TPA: hypothetical protein VFI17_10105 [Solirubrobacterales bacterium]|nr:hypothetical protein [Solirubrobacterales bacterium]